MGDREEQITDLSQQRSRGDRGDRVDFLEEERISRANALEVERERRAQQLAYAQGRREADVDSHLRNLDEMVRSHSERLKAINGSIERTGTALQTLIDEVKTKNAVEKALHEALENANANSLNEKTFRWGIVGVMVMLTGVCISLLVAVHAL